MKIVIYTTETCPKCKRLETYMDSRKLQYSIRDMQDPKNRAILMSMNVFSTTAPVLDADGTYLTADDLFVGNELDRGLVDYWLGLDNEMK